MTVPLILCLLAMPPPPVDFDTDVLPVLANAGCNAGACHGAAAGRGGFKLSLFGGDPAADHRAIVRELEGRRVNLARPERSLLLLKPTWQLDHEGGQRFAADSESARVLTAWIAGGAGRSARRQLASLAVKASAEIVERVPAEVALAAVARFSDGTTRDVAGLAIYTPADPAATPVDPAGNVRVLRPGRHTIVVRFLTQVQAVQITAPYDNAPLDLSGAARKNWIDDEINATLATLRLAPLAAADDATLLRRITLDLTGRLPIPDRARDYLSDSRPDKYEREVDRLLASPAFSEYWTFKLAQWLRVRVAPNDVPGTQQYFTWLREQVAANRPLDELAAELITASGDSHAVGPPNFHRSAGDARAAAEHLAETLLAVRIRCANCHNHPLDRWTQDDYHGLAAIFAPLERGRQVRLKPSGSVIHPATGEAARPRIPGERYLEPATLDGRGELAAWLADRDNRYFARAWVNRLWESLLGRGLVHPVDDLRDTNPATHPALLDRLAADFAAHDYDLQHALRLIATSAAYQRSSRPATAGRPGDARSYARAGVRNLPSAVLLDLVCDATGLPNGYSEPPAAGLGAERLASRAIELYDQRLAADELGPLATCRPGEACAGEAASLASLKELANQLHWLNGSIVNQRLRSPDQAFRQLAASGLPTSRLVEEYYLRTLSRLPSAAELQYWTAELDGPDRATKCEDFAWSLLSCPEFVTNH